MNAREWKKKIKKACLTANTYEKHYDLIIEALADILEKRDAALESYDGNPVVSHTNSHGETNMAKNPALMIWLDCNKVALAYWRDLGLTPAALKKITGEVKKEEKGSALIRALESAGSA